MRRVATIPGIIAQHAEDAAFLWTQRRGEIDGRSFGEIDVGRIDQRLSAHLAGLIEAGEAGWNAARARYADYPEAGEVFVLAMLALHAGEAAALDAALDAARAAGTEGRRGFSGAIARTPPDRLRPCVADWLAAADPFRRYLGVCALSHHRVDPQGRLAEVLADADADVRARGLRLVGEIGRRNQAAALQAAADAGAEERFWAARSAGLVGAFDLAGPGLERIVREAGPRATAATDLLLLAGPPQASRIWLGELIARQGGEGPAIAHVGVLGDRGVLPWLIRRMRAPGAAAAAGCALRDLFAIDFDDTDLFTADAGVLGDGLAAVEERPLPVADRVKAWWADGRGGPVEETRPAMRQLALQALRQAIATPGRPLGAWRRTRRFPAWS